MTARKYASRRKRIIDALVDKLKTINGQGAFLTDVGENVHPRLKFWDEVDEFPALHLNAGSETREYQTAGVRDRFLSVTIRCYVQEEEAQEALNELMEDVETVLEDNSRLAYTDKMNNVFYTQQITVISIDTDEGVLEPLGVGELLIEVRYYKLLARIKIHDPSFQDHREKILWQNIYILVETRDSTWKKTGIFGLFQCLMDLVFLKPRMRPR